MSILKQFAYVFLWMVIFAAGTLGLPRLSSAEDETKSVIQMTEEEAASAYKKGGQLESPEEKRERMKRERELQQRSINQVHEHQQRIEDQVDVERLENMRKKSK